MKLNKKGATLGGWTEAILLSVLFIFAFASVIVGMNAKYNKNYDGTLGLAPDAIQEQFADYQNSLQTSSQGDATFTSVNGLSLSTSWALIKSTGNLVWGFITGGWTEKLVYAMHFPAYFALIFRILWFCSIGFIILTILFKVRP